MFIYIYTLADKSLERVRFVNVKKKEKKKAILLSKAAFI